MGKILIFLRVSTESQELENQRKEMEDFVKSMGYSSEDCVFVEGIGASAIKINDEYISMYNEVKRHIDGGDISAVAVWHLNRLSRSEEWFIKFKNLFIDNKVNFLVKNPTLVLLNPDGSVNTGVELALSLFSTMAKNEMIERQEKFKRTKRAYARQGKWPGGRTKRFGYAVDENHFFVPDDNDGYIVKLAFQLYSTGEYSAERIVREMNERGLKRNDGLPINTPFITRMLASKSYTGEPDEKNNNRVYPPLITKELYDKCREIATGNRLSMRQGERIVLGAKLLKCPVCGCTYTSNSRHFMCTAGLHKDCDKLSIRQVVVDEILWRYAYPLHMEYLMDLNEGKIEKYREQVEIIRDKVASYGDMINASADKKTRIIDTYLEGLIDKKTRDLRLSKVDSDTLVYQNEINSLQEQERAILGLLENVNGDLDELNFINALDMIDIAAEDKQKKYDIIHMHILKITPERIQYGRKDPRVTRDNGVLFRIYFVNGKDTKVIFIPKYYQGHNLYIWNGKDWIPDMVDLYDNIYVPKAK